jgi:hypothetical protein
MVRHDDEAVEEVAGLFSVSEEGGEKDFSVCGPLEEADAVVCDGGEGVGLRLEAHSGKFIMPGLKPRPTSEATATTKATTTARWLQAVGLFDPFDSDSTFAEAEDR